MIDQILESTRDLPLGLIPRRAPAEDDSPVREFDSIDDLHTERARPLRISFMEVGLRCFSGAWRCL